ncbi:hypothetical protein PFISCL1PPCAC_19584, partial [Pristionchus fissidentatus]
AVSILSPILDRFNKLFSENNLDELISLYGSDAVMVTKGESCAYGREAIKSGLAEFTAKGKIDSKMINRKIEGVGEHIILRAEFDATVISTGEHITGKFQQIFRKEGDEWLIIFDEFQG